MENTHIVSAFDDDLNNLNARIEQLGELAKERFVMALDAIATQDSKTLDHIIAGDKELDVLEAEIIQTAFEIIALRSPRATDLRRVMVASKIATIFERVGDFSKNIARRTKAIAASGHETIPDVNIGRMGHMAEKMINDAMLAYHNLDIKAAIELRNSDVELDHMHTAFYNEVMAMMTDDSKVVGSGVHLLFIGKNIERIGDYMTGIAEEIYFLVEGTQLEDERPKADKSSSKLS
ncbi:MAG: phosphate signaling complex protein PhoU [Candidatus Puniceispirillum sp.]|jgi:phosphate transport system protein|nr:phosphate signaling complex protein PhoU [Candidatus Puniceispirillum sp.]MBT6565689.1 phosphate signaling complex protein PhoU [Candidatus Puniceispirillum sp.]